MKKTTPFALTLSAALSAALCAAPAFAQEGVIATVAVVVAQGQDADPASVAFDALQQAKARGFDILIADTAGRLHNKTHLMQELGRGGSGVVYLALDPLLNREVAVKVPRPEVMLIGEPITLPLST